MNEIRTPSLLVSRGPRRLTKIVLFPVRFLFTAETGQVGTNSLAAEHYLASARAPAAKLVSAAPAGASNRRQVTRRPHSWAAS